MKFKFRWNYLIFALAFIPGWIIVDNTFTNGQEHLQGSLAVLYLVFISSLYSGYLTQSKKDV